MLLHEVISEVVDVLFDDESLCNDYVQTSIIFDKELHKSVSLDEDNHHLFRSILVFGNLYHEASSSKFQPFCNPPEIVHLRENGTIFDSPSSFADKSNPSPLFNYSEASNRITRTKKRHANTTLKKSLFSASNTFLSVYIIFYLKPKLNEAAYGKSTETSSIVYF